MMKQLRRFYCEECGKEIGFIDETIQVDNPFVAYCKKCDVRIRALTELKDPKKWPAIEAELAKTEAVVEERERVHERLIVDTLVRNWDTVLEAEE